MKKSEKGVGQFWPSFQKKRDSGFWGRKIEHPERYDELYPNDKTKTRRDEFENSECSRILEVVITSSSNSRKLTA